MKVGQLRRALGDNNRSGSRVYFGRPCGQILCNADHAAAGRVACIAQLDNRQRTEAHVCAQHKGLHCILAPNHPPSMMTPLKAASGHESFAQPADHPSGQQGPAV